MDIMLMIEKIQELLRHFPICVHTGNTVNFPIVGLTKEYLNL